VCTTASRGRATKRHFQTADANCVTCANATKRACCASVVGRRRAAYGVGGGPRGGGPVTAHRTRRNPHSSPWTADSARPRRAFRSQVGRLRANFASFDLAGNGTPRRLISVARGALTQRTRSSSNGPAHTHSLSAIKSTSAPSNTRPAAMLSLPSPAALHFTLTQRCFCRYGVGQGNRCHPAHTGPHGARGQPCHSTARGEVSSAFAPTSEGFAVSGACTIWESLYRPSPPL
jgi:hypothetical protein